MKLFISFLLLMSFVLIGCGKEKETPKELPAGVRAVTVVSTQDAAGYTYVEGEENGVEIWLATTPMEVKKGETIYFSRAMEMKDFKSEELNKTFASLLFVEDASKTPELGISKDVMGTMHSQASKTEKISEVITPLAGGKTVAEMITGAESLNGQTVKFRGKAVKVNEGIMDLNWIHIQDGTAAGDAFSIVATSNDLVTVGQIVTVEGTLVTNKDFGSGYVYKYIVEKAKIKAE
ncbi:MAG: DNA-binding protein [Chlorobiaceae bacterium]|nr:DNA-binding protein [Chlorobiaceae bacterium]MBA4310245.1 DNA-binding protein [Chlorobiaceae bacterium]